MALAEERNQRQADDFGLPDNHTLDARLEVCGQAADRFHILRRETAGGDIGHGALLLERRS